MKVILIVDDSATSRMLFRVHMPKDVACEIHEAGNADTALKLAIDCHPDIIVLDYNMPDKNGIELAQAMQEAGVQAHYFLLTPNTQKSVVDAANRLGFISVIEKPITNERIRLLLERAG
jgi:DNA-binding NarL/FixJ family response regulator